MLNRTWTIAVGVAMALAWVCGEEHRARIRDVNRVSSAEVPSQIAAINRPEAPRAACAGAQDP